MNLIEKLKAGAVLLDGAMGTCLEGRGLPAGSPPELYNSLKPEEVEKIHRGYVDAGCDVVCANTFGINPFRYADCEQMIAKAVGIALRAADGKAAVALDVGPTGKLLRPIGDLPFEDAVNCFKRVISAGVSAGAELIFIETINDLYELKAAILAAKESCNLPVFASCAFGADGKLTTGASPEAVVALAEGLGADAVGLNCSLAPSQMTETVKKLYACASVPVIAKPNAGLPQIADGKTVYDVDSQMFCKDMLQLLKAGARCVGGCCGTDASFISGLKKLLKGVTPLPVAQRDKTTVCSYTHALEIGDYPVLIGERINPTGKKRLKQAIQEGDFAYILGEAAGQAEKGVHALDVNVGVAGVDEKKILTEVVAAVQAVTDLPLQIDTSDPAAMDAAMRIYNGKPLVNSVNGKKSSMRAVFPLVKKYGGAAIALTLDENGVPPTAEGRIKIAKRILREAKKYGLKKSDIVFDTLATAVAAEGGSATAALDSLRYIRGRMGANVSLGVSNISFGLPDRDAVTAAFLTMALSHGLSAAIVNPYSDRVMGAYKSFMALSGKDKNCMEYIDFASRNAQPREALPAAHTGAEGLKRSITRGLKEDAARLSAELCSTLSAQEVIEAHIVPALDEVGAAFESKKIFLPQLLISAEAASAAFDAVKPYIKRVGTGKKLKIVLATVRGDVHDIGKNIVKTMLANYGFAVIDLGKDVPPEKIVRAAAETGAGLVGLSALMTTTVGAMESTVKLIKKQLPHCKCIVGGAVITAEYAAEIGADAYGKDAMQTVRYAESIEKLL